MTALSGWQCDHCEDVMPPRAVGLAGWVSLIVGHHSTPGGAHTIGDFCSLRCLEAWILVHSNCSVHRGCEAVEGMDHGRDLDR